MKELRDWKCPVGYKTPAVCAAQVLLSKLCVTCQQVEITDRLKENEAEDEPFYYTED